MRRDSHLSDAQLLLELEGEVELEGELSARDLKQLRAHLAECWQCRARRQEMERTIGDFSRLHRQQSDRQLPPHAGPRALLKARLAQLSEAQPDAARNWTWVLAMAACVALFAVMFLVRRPVPSHNPAVSIPDSRLTPGAALLATRESVCSQPNTKNRAVPVALRRKVFEAYGLSNAEPRDYEVDYLITPALGGADDIHNLWPQPHSATVWNAEVKDALEDRLRDLVCDGTVDLTEAQREIAVNWIAAYKKYFHTDRPLADHDKQ